MQPTGRKALTVARGCPGGERSGFVRFQVLHIDHETSDKVIRDPRVSFVNFTGSVAGGHSVQKSASERFIGACGDRGVRSRCTAVWHTASPPKLAGPPPAPSHTATGLELGGKDPAYVRPDCNLDYTVDQLVDGSFYNSGQCCCAIERIYVHEAVYDAFVDKFVALTKVRAGGRSARARSARRLFPDSALVCLRVGGLAARRMRQQYRLGNPLDAQTNLGPMVKASAADAVRKQIEDAGTPGWAVARRDRGLGSPSARARAVRPGTSGVRAAASVAKGAKALIDTSAFPADKVGTAAGPYRAVAGRKTDRTHGPCCGTGCWPGGDGGAGGHAVHGAAGAGECGPHHGRDDGRKLRPGHRHHEGPERAAGGGTAQRTGPDVEEGRRMLSNP